MADKVTVTMRHPEAKEPIEVMPGQVPEMKGKGWEVKTTPPKKKKEGK